MVRDDDCGDRSGPFGLKKNRGLGRPVTAVIHLFKLTSLASSTLRRKASGLWLLVRSYWSLVSVLQAMIARRSSWRMAIVGP
jgi:hypothetical protein